MRRKLSGVWLPIITPFRDGQVDFTSYRRLIEHYLGKGIAGLVPLGTTGESPTIEEAEFEEMVARTVEYVAGRVPVFVGVGGNYTKKVLHLLKLAEKYPIQGILSVCPYYNRPDQAGIYEHFRAISEATALDIVIYNIPYRTGRNIENETIRRLAELPNVVGLKDSCGDIKQTMELLLDPPAEFSILTGEDALYYLTLALGGDGGILASAHLATEGFVRVYEAMKANDHRTALAEWRRLARFIPLLFKEPNPAPVKYCLKRLGLIESSETRLPLVEISAGLKARLDEALAELT
ncbi:MAG: 4-hydroxy-tetrahydrodipicolinate synthase [Firmicutes bacterium]|nr:4-hydroxy-tetrahydrodipicolinate synthase [Bacillota bacterium]